MDGQTILNKARKGKAKLAATPAPTAPPPGYDTASNGDGGSSPKTLETVEAAPFPHDPVPAAFHGLAGELVNTIDPHTEASRVGILVQTLISFGNVIGPQCHFRVEDTKHSLNLFAVMVGQTSKGRKGTSWGRVRDIFAAVDPVWTDKRIVGGLSSGEGLIWEVRDAVFKNEAVREKGEAPHFEKVETDPGITDKRLLVLEAEFASVLKQADRSGNILSATLRQAWDSGDIRTMSKNSPAQATGAHISCIGHITAEELRRVLSSTEAANGTGNRILWVAVKRSKLLPDGGGAIDMGPLKKRFFDAVEFSKCVNMIPRDDEARELWHEVYPKLSRERAGLVGALTARAEAQTMRLACLYALLDHSCLVEGCHLKAALALWDYCDRSTSFVFGHSTGDVVADEILAELRKTTDGMSRDDIFSLFSRHQTKDRVERSLLILEQAELAKRERVATGGRPKEIWTYRRARKA